MTDKQVNKLCRAIIGSTFLLLGAVACLLDALEDWYQPDIRWVAIICFMTGLCLIFWELLIKLYGVVFPDSKQENRKNNEE